MGAGLVDVLDRALADQHVVALVIDHDRHALALEVERDLVHFPAVPVHVQIRVREDRPVEQVPQPGLVIAVHVRIPEHVVAFAVRDVHVLFEDDAVLGERAGFVRAEDVDGAEVLDRVEPLDDDLLFRHGHRAFGQVHRHDHRQHFRGEADGDREAEEKRYHPVAFRDPDDEKNDAHHDDHEADHQPREPGDPAVEARLHAPAGEFFGERSELRANPGIHDDAARGTAQHVAPLEAGVGKLDDPTAGNLRGVGAFFHRHRFAGQRRLAHEKIFGGDEAEVGGDDRAGLEGDDVAGDDFRSGDLDLGAVARDQALGLHHFAELFDRFAGPVFLKVGQAHAQDHHGPHNGCHAKISHADRNCADDQQLDDERVTASLENLPEKPQFLPVGKIVGAKLFEGFFHLLRREAAGPGTHALERLGGGLPADFYEFPLRLRRGTRN